ncbi:MAG: hypothetical protein M0Z73_06125 [Betaproteobacteria bacterium]|nr:hypothetical protein [Betaproteobacteria bacterium]
MKTKSLLALLAGILAVSGLPAFAADTTAPATEHAAPAKHKPVRHVKETQKAEKKEERKENKKEERKETRTQEKKEEMTK